MMLDICLMSKKIFLFKEFNLSMIPERFKIKGSYFDIRLI
jgi:hypothetical protein